MTCFWDGLLHNLKDEDFKRTFNDQSMIKNKIKNIDFVKLMKANNVKTKDITWNGEKLTEQQLNENFEHIRDYNENSIYGGYLCSTCDPFLLLVCHLFKVDINHNYCGYMMKYRVKNPVKTLNFKSNTGHFMAC